MQHRTASTLRPGHLGWIIALAGLVALLGFAVSMDQARAEDPDAEATVDLDLGLDGGLDGSLDSSGSAEGTLGTFGAVVDLNATGDAGVTADTTSTIDSTTNSVIDDVEACVTCEDAVAESHVSGGDIPGDTQADVCVIGDCTGGESTDVLHSTFVSGENTIAEDTTAEVCVLADCYPDESAAGRILVNSEGNDTLGDTAADVCILGDCTGNGDLDGVVGTVGTDSSTAGDTSADAEVCILANCANSDAGTTDGVDDGTNGETGTQSITNDSNPGADNPTGDDSDIPLGDPIGDPTTGGSDDASSQGPNGDAQSGSSQQGLPLAGFGPMADMSGYALPLTALLLLGASWVVGAYLIRRHG